MISLAKGFWARTGLQIFAYRMPLAVALVVVLAGLLLSINISEYPQSWFDEGLNFGTAAELARTGQYALPDSQGARVLDPAIQTGPLLLVPIALIYRDLGASILLGRMVMIVFSAGALVAYALLARRLVGTTAMFLALGILLAGNGEIYTSFVPMARQGLGEVTAIGLICYGMRLWLRDQQQASWRQLVVIGLAFGLAMITKSQFLVIFPVAWGALCLIDRGYYRQASWRAFLLPGIAMVACVGCWYAAQRLIVGPEQFAQNAAILREGFALHIAGFNLTNIRHALGSLWRVGFVFWALPGLLYGLWLARTRDVKGLAQASMIIFAWLWLLWFVGLSIGWERYGFVALALAPIWMARLLVDLLRDERLHPYRRAALLGIGLLLMVQGWSIAKPIFAPPSDDMRAFAQALEAKVPADAVIASWEWELDVVVPRRFHHPPTPVTNAVTREIMREGKANTQYDPSAAAPEYLVDGPFSSWTGVFRQYIADHCELLVKIGRYTLYRVAR